MRSGYLLAACAVSKPLFAIARQVYLPKAVMLRSAMSLRTLPLLCLLICALPTLAADDAVDDFMNSVRNIEIFQIRKSALACPVILVGQSCPEENPLYYFKCCGDLGSSCCFRLQDWVMVLMIILVVCIVVSIVVNFIRCLCCY